MIRQLLIGILAGAFYGSLGYLKSNERFSFKKFSRALIIEILISIFSIKIYRENLLLVFLLSASTIC
jgi:hypothetical protein